MDTSTFSNLYTLTKNSFNQSTSLEATLVRGTEADIKSSPNFQLNALILLSLFGFVLMWQVIFFSIKVTRLGLKGKVVSYRCQQVPCINCQFFIKNNYLKCAVHPATVLTKQALDCPDYQTNKSDSFYYNRK